MERDRDITQRELHYHVAGSFKNVILDLYIIIIKYKDNLLTFLKYTT